MQTETPNYSGWVCADNEAQAAERTNSRITIGAPQHASAAVHWVLHPWAAEGLVKLQAASEEDHVPQKGEVIQRQFLIDSRTHVPVPVRVVQRLDWTEMDGRYFVVLVARDKAAS